MFFCSAQNFKSIQRGHCQGPLRVPQAYFGHHLVNPYIWGWAFGGNFHSIRSEGCYSYPKQTEQPLQVPVTHGNPPSCDSFPFTQWLTCNLPPALNKTITVTWGDVKNQPLFSLAKFTGAEWSGQLVFSLDVRLVSFSSEAWLLAAAVSETEGWIHRWLCSKCWCNEQSVFSLSWGAWVWLQRILWLRESCWTHICTNGAIWCLEGEVHILVVAVEASLLKAKISWNCTLFLFLFGLYHFEINHFLHFLF